jgi:nucleotide-binding universal stress UspA family protein
MTLQSTPFRKILVPTDFSPRAQEALDQAVLLGLPGATDLVALHVIEPVVMPLGGLGEPMMPPFDAKFWMEQSESRLREFVLAAAGRGFAVKTLLRWGRPFEEIVGAAKDEAADLVVIGSGGHGRMTYALLGSTVERVARLAPCPVLIMRPKG